MWTNWKPLPGAESNWQISDLKELLQGGQSFRWFFDEQRQSYTGGWGNKLVRLRVSEEGQLQVSYPQVKEPDLAPSTQELLTYLGQTGEQKQLRENLPWRSDPVLKGAMDHFPRLRILQQPPGEALLSFLCSATKQIPQIQKGLEEIGRRFGQPLWGRHYALPCWEDLADIPVEAMRGTGIGFRARHIAGTAAFLRKEPGYLQTVATLPYLQARQALIRLPGVGTKVADCALLFGFQKWEAFPVDTWIAKALGRLYGLHNWSLPQLEAFGRIHFGTGAGLAQQYLFSAIRNQSL